jgi:hypothetical protein
VTQAPLPADRSVRRWPPPRELALVAVVLATFASCVLVTPWQRVSADGHRASFAGYAPLYRPPAVPLRDPERQGYSVVRPLENFRIDRSRLALQLAVCGLVAAGVAAIFRK